MRCSPDGRFLENTTIRALPTQPGDYVQAKLFFGGYFGNTLNDRIPSRICFDMHLGGPASRIGQIDPPACFFGLDLHQMTCHRSRHVPFLGCHLEVNTRLEDLVARLILGLNLFQDLRCLVDHSQLEVAARSKDMLLPIGLQGIGDSWRKTKSALVASQVTSRKAPAVTANTMSDQK